MKNKSRKRVSASIKSDDKKVQKIKKKIIQDESDEEMISVNAKSKES